jgi:hypothetical protein
VQNALYLRLKPKNQIKMNKPTKYVYPVGDFLSGFSEDPKNPCDYELECQRMVIRGVEYLDEFPEIAELVDKGQTRVFDDALKPMIEWMCLNVYNLEDSGNQTGAMVSHTTRHAFVAHKQGWDKYIEIITSKEEE